ncbi:XRE family transcriptional regulator [Tabrizicola sp. WMC-M-20]|nr:XRE family transcriptional regulator [Tabrizicola sp. WMC-M-20]
MTKTISSPGHRALVRALADARKAAGMTQIELAKALKCQQSLIARIESGQRRIDVVDVVLWARAVGARSNQFVDVVEQHTP